MSLATLSLDQILKTPFPSYHKPLELARSLTRSGNEDDRHKAVALLDRLRQRYPHVLAIGQELVLALEECHEPDRAEQMLKTLEKSFLNLDEEFLCRWGRLFKDRGDDYTSLPWSNPGRRLPDPVLAEAFYRKSIAKYDQAYRIRFGHYPGVNKATLLLIVGALKKQRTGSAPVSISELLESEELAQASRVSSVLESGPLRRRIDLAPRHCRRMPSAQSGMGASNRSLPRGAWCEEHEPSRPGVDAPPG